MLTESVSYKQAENKKKGKEAYILTVIDLSINYFGEYVSKYNIVYIGLFSSH